MMLKGAACVCCAVQMRNAVKASRNGYVDEVMVKEGEIVAADQPLLKFW
jgi:biotin carboxyl carrier protein